MFCAVKVSTSVHEGATTATQVATTANQIVDKAPAVAGKAAFEAGKEGVHGAATGAVQVVATVPMAPVTVVGRVVESVLPSQQDRDNVERVVNPAKWRF